MGSPLAPTITKLYMKSFKQKAIFVLLPTDPIFSCAMRFLLWAHGHKNLDDSFEYLNSINDDIQFTIEQENNKWIPFLDVLVNKD